MWLYQSYYVDILIEVASISNVVQIEKNICDAETEVVQRVQEKLLPRKVSLLNTSDQIDVSELTESFTEMVSKFLSSCDPIIHVMEEELGSDKDQFVSAVMRVICKETDNTTVAERDVQLVSWGEDLEKLAVRMLHTVFIKVDSIFGKEIPLLNELCQVHFTHL